MKCLFQLIRLLIKWSWLAQRPFSDQRMNECFEACIHVHNTQVTMHQHVFRHATHTAISQIHLTAEHNSLVLRPRSQQQLNFIKPVFNNFGMLQPFSQSIDSLLMNANKAAIHEDQSCT